MKLNMGGADRGIRVVAAIVMAILILTGTVSGWVAIVLGVVAAIFVLTSVVSFCPLYVPFGFSTRSKK